MAVPLAAAFIRLRPQTDQRAFEKDGAAAGSAAGKSYADGFYRDSSGRLRQANGRFATDAQKAMLGAGGSSGKGFGNAFNREGGGIIRKGFSALKNQLGPLLVPLGAGAAVLAIGKIGIEYENNLNIFQAVTKATGQQMDQVAKKARDLGADVKLPGVSAAGAAAAMTELSKAGFSVQQSMDAAQATLQLSRIANIDEGKAAEIAANAVNAFGIKASDVNGVVDELAATANSSSVEIGDVSLAFKQAAAVFAGFQGPAVGSQEAITELNTAIAILGNAGIKGSDAGTSLKQMLLQLTGPTQQAKDIMKELALNAFGANVSLESQNKILHGSKSVREKEIANLAKQNDAQGKMGDIAFDAAGKMRPLSQIVDLVAKGTKGMTDEEKDYAVTQIFGADASRAVIALLKGGLPVYDQTRKAVLEQGAAGKVAAAQNKGLGGAIDNVRSQFENAAISIFNQVKGPLTTGLNNAAKALAPLADGINDFGNFVRNNSGTIGAFAAVLGGAAAAYLALRAAIVITTAAQKAFVVLQTAVAFVQLASQVRSFAEAWALLDVAMAANPIGLVVVAIGALVAGIIVAYKHSETFRNIVQGALHGIVVAAQAVASFFTGVVWPALQAAWNGIATGALWLWHNVFEPVWHGIQAVIGVVVTIVRGYINALVVEFNIIKTVALFLWHNVFSPVFSGIAKVVQIAWLIIEVIFKALQIIISKTIIPVIQGLHSVWNAVFAALRAAVQGWWSIIRTIFGLFQKYLLGPVISFIVGWKDRIVATFHVIAAAIADWYNNHIKKYIDAVRIIWGQLGTAISNIWNGHIKPIFSGIVGYFKGQFVNGFKGAIDLVKGIWGGLEKVAKAPVTFVVNHVINPFINGLNTAASIVGIKDRVSPIKGFADGGQVPGYASGGRITGAPSSSDNRMAPARIPGVGAVKLAGGEYVVNASDTRKALPILQWINSGMKRGGPRAARKLIGRPMADMPGDGSEGWAFKDGGLVGWAKDVWSAVSHPLDTIKKPFEAALGKIPGSGTLKNFLVGSANHLVDGAISWVKKISGGSGKVGDAIKFLHAQDGKPYIWASAGPDGYDCSGIVSAIYNILHGHNPYSHTFSTESAGSFFPKPGQNGQMAAAWSHPGQSPASNSVGHMMGRVGNLNFESTGSRGVHLGNTTRKLSDFAQIGHYAHGGMVSPMPVRLFDQGGFWPSGTLGANLSGRTEYVDPSGRGGGDLHIHLHNNGVIASQEETDAWLSNGLRRLDRARKLPGRFGKA